MKPRPLRIYREGSAWWMDHGGDLTDDLAHSSGGEWVAGFFTKMHGNGIVLTDRKRVAVEFLCGEVSHRALSKSGVLALLVSGSNNHMRIDLMRGDGSSATIAGTKRLIQVESLAFTPDEKGLILERHDGKEALDLTGLMWKKNGRVTTYGSANLPSWAVWAIFGAVAAFFVMLAVM